MDLIEERAAGDMYGRIVNTTDKYRQLAVQTSRGSQDRFKALDLEGDACQRSLIWLKRVRLMLDRN